VKTSSNMNTQKRVLLALYNMGGPGGQNDVEPFLRALFTDPDLLDIPFGRWLQNFVADKIIRKRLDEVKARYRLMGGGSPQLPITDRVCEKLATFLRTESESIGLFRAGSETESAPQTSSAPFEIIGVTPLFRYSEPRAETVLDLCIKNNADELWLVSQYPHCARATTGTSLREIGLAQRNHEKFSNITVRSLASYGDDPNFLDLWTRRLEQSWSQLPAGKKHLLISAHNLPLSYVAEGDPYPIQIRRTAQEVTRRLGLHEGLDWTLCWQSAVGPVRWMNPTTEASIDKICSAGVEHVLVWPVAFVSDHIETLVEIDLEYAELAHKKGCKTFTRVKNFDSDEDFISFLGHQVSRAARDLLRTKSTPLLRDFNERKTGPHCAAQPGGCLCANYYLSGRAGIERGKLMARLDETSKVSST
jgi:ferrochelatase